jgi:hypothetical protein
MGPGKKRSLLPEQIAWQSTAEVAAGNQRPGKWLSEGALGAWRFKNSMVIRIYALVAYMEKLRIEN